MEHYIYVYLDTRKRGRYVYDDLEFEYEPFYIGQGTKYRYKSGLVSGGSPYKRNKINKIIKDGFEPKVLKIYENLDSETVSKLEIEIILKIGRSDLKKGPLVNLTDGGEGTTNISKEIIKKRADSQKGRKHSEESKEKMSLSRKKYFEKGNTTWNKGRQWTDEERLKLTNKSNLGRRLSDEHKNKMSKNAKRQILEGKSIIKLRKVVQYTLIGDFIEEYESIKNASIQNNIPQTSIRYCCLKKLKHAGGFYWEFKNK